MSSRTLDIPEKQLRLLYIHKQLSTGAIAKIYNCNHVTILNYLKKYNIPRRSRLGSRKPIYISKGVLFDLYHNKKLTQKQIAKKFGHSRYGIQRWMKKYEIQSKPDSEIHAKFPKLDFDGDQIEKAYMIGFRLGDLNVYQAHNLIQVRCSTTINNQVFLIKKLFIKYGHVHSWKAKRGTYEIIVLLNDSFTFLLPKNDKIEPWILTDRKYFLSFFAGYADAEGSYYLKKPNPKVGKVECSAFEIQSFDKNILLCIHQKLKSYKIENLYSLSRRGGYVDRRGIRTNKDCWRVVINKKQTLWNFIKLIEPYHRHRNKIRSLREIKNNLLLRNHLPYCKPIIL